MVRYKTIIDDFKSICENHLQINSFGVGDLRQLGYFLQLNTDEDKDKVSNEGSKSPTYPLVFIVPQPISRDRRTITYTFNVLVMDIIKDDMSNEIDVHNDTIMIAEDILAQFGYGVSPQQGNFYDKYEIITPTSITPFSESFDDYVSGVNLTITLLVDSPLDRCISPFKDFNETNLILQEDGDIILTEDNNNLEQE
jgi:hypothetical protein